MRTTRSTLFRDRREAGRALGERVKDLALESPVVVALGDRQAGGPPGGVYAREGLSALVGSEEMGATQLLMRGFAFWALELIGGCRDRRLQWAGGVCAAATKRVPAFVELDANRFEQATFARVNLAIVTQPVLELDQFFDPSPDVGGISQILLRGRGQGSPLAAALHALWTSRRGKAVRTLVLVPEKAAVSG